MLSGSLFATFDETGAPRTASLEEVKVSVGTPALQSQLAAQQSAAATSLAGVVTTFNGAVAVARAETASAVAQLRAAAAFISDEIARAQGGEALINARVDTLTSTVGGNTASIMSEVATRASADAALGVRIDTVTATAGANTTAISSETVARASADTALGGRIDTVVATAGANTTAISSEVVARTSADTALGGRIDTLTATVGTNTAAISTEATARASGDSALSSTVSSLTATVGSNTASITTQAAAISTLNGRTATIWQVTEVLGDGTARIALVNSGGASTFLIDATNTLISGNLFVAGSISTGKIADQAVTRALAAESTTALNVAYNTPQSSPAVGLSIDLTSPSGSTVRVDIDLYASPVTYVPPGTSFVLCYGRFVRIQGGTTTELLGWTPLPLLFYKKVYLDTPAAGPTATYQFQFASSDPDGRTSTWPVNDQVLILTEIKK